MSRHRSSDSDWNQWNFFNGSTRTPRLPAGEYGYSSILWFGSIRVDLLQSSTIVIGSLTIDLSCDLLPFTIGFNENPQTTQRQAQSRAPSPVFSRNLVIGPLDRPLVNNEPTIIPLTMALVQRAGAVNPLDSDFSPFSHQVPTSSSTPAPTSSQSLYTPQLNQSRANHFPPGSNMNPQ